MVFFVVPERTNAPNYFAANFAAFAKILKNFRTVLYFAGLQKVFNPGQTGNFRYYSYDLLKRIS